MVHEQPQAAVRAVLGAAVLDDVLRRLDGLRAGARSAVATRLQSVTQSAIWHHDR